MSEDKLFSRIETISNNCHEIIYRSLGKYLDVSGNIGVFCQSKNEYKEFMRFSKVLIKKSDDPKQKYYQLIDPIVISYKGIKLDAIYTHLYIRKYDSSSYGRYLGDVDFILSNKDYLELKYRVEKEALDGAQMYDRPGWDTIQFTNSEINAVAYVSTKEFAEKVRLDFD